MNKEEKEAIEEFKREVEDGRISGSDILLSRDTGIIILNLLNEREELKMKKEEKIQNYYNMLREFYYEKNGLEATIDFLEEMTDLLKEEMEI